MFVTFDVRDRLIARTTLLDPNKKVGELILAWGSPSGHQKLTLGNYVYWQGRYVYVAARDFGPQSNVSFIVFDNRPTNMDPWQGFVNRRK